MTQLGIGPTTSCCQGGLDGMYWDYEMGPLFSGIYVPSIIGFNGQKIEQGRVGNMVSKKVGPKNRGTLTLIWVLPFQRNNQAQSLQRWGGGHLPSQQKAQPQVQT